MKLMLVDDHTLFLEGLKYLLSTHGIEVAGTANNGSDALEKARALHPDVILMDIKMPECDGIAAMKLIKAEMPDIKIVVLTTSDEEEDLFNAIKYGASGYLLKSIDAEELVSTLAGLEDGEILLSPGLALQTLREFRAVQSGGGSKIQTIENPEKEKLSERQLEILELVSEGVTYKETGKRLGISERTVKYHMGRIIELLHYENRAQVIAYATRIGVAEETNPAENR